MTRLMTLEDALIALTQATDGRGLPVRLYSGQLTAAALRVAAREFAESLIAPDAVWLCGLSPESESLAHAAEAAAWDNLALLARATAAAIRAEQGGCLK